MVVTNSDELTKKIKLYRNHGHHSKYEHFVIGYNGRIDEIQAAILRIKLKYLDEYNQRRREKASLYSSLLRDIPIILPIEAQGRLHVYHLFVIRSKKRGRLQQYLQEHGIGTGIHYKNPVHLQKACRKLGYKKGDFPNVEKACSEILSLPLYPGLDQNNQVYIARKIKEFYDFNL
jgi:dTDP-4-amino-4,6-dideoxygalactose transaminase